MTIAGRVQAEATAVAGNRATTRGTGSGDGEEFFAAMREAGASRDSGNAASAKRSADHAGRTGSGARDAVKERASGAKDTDDLTDIVASVAEAEDESAAKAGSADDAAATKRRAQTRSAGQAQTPGKVRTVGDAVDTSGEGDAAASAKGADGAKGTDGAEGAVQGDDRASMRAEGRKGRAAAPQPAATAGRTADTAQAAGTAGDAAVPADAAIERTDRNARPGAGDAAPAIDSSGRRRPALHAPAAAVATADPELTRLRLLQAGVGVENPTVGLQLSAEQTARRLGLLLPGETNMAGQKDVAPTPPRSGRTIVTVGRGELVAERSQEEERVIEAAKAATTSPAPLSPEAKLAAILGGFGLESRIFAAADTAPNADGGARAAATSDAAQPAHEQVARDPGIMTSAAPAALRAGISAGTGPGTGPGTGAASGEAAGGPSSAAGTAQPGATASTSEEALPAGAAKAPPAVETRPTFVVPSRNAGDLTDKLASRIAAAGGTGEAAGSVHTDSADRVDAAVLRRAPRQAASTSTLGAKVDLVSMRTDFEPATRRAERQATVDAPARASGAAAPAQPDTTSRVMAAASAIVDAPATSRRPTVEAAVAAPVAPSAPSTVPAAREPGVTAPAVSAPAVAAPVAAAPVDVAPVAAAPGVTASAVSAPAVVAPVAAAPVVSAPVVAAAGLPAAQGLAGRTTAVSQPAGTREPRAVPASARESASAPAAAKAAAFAMPKAAVPPAAGQQTGTGAVERPAARPAAASGASARTDTLPQDRGPAPARGEAAAATATATEPLAGADRSGGDRSGAAKAGERSITAAANGQPAPVTRDGADQPAATNAMSRTAAPAPQAASPATAASPQVTSPAPSASLPAPDGAAGPSASPAPGPATAGMSVPANSSPPVGEVAPKLSMPIAGHDAAGAGRASAVAAPSDRSAPAARQEAAPASRGTAANSDSAAASPAGVSRAPQQAEPRHEQPKAIPGQGMSETKSPAGPAPTANVATGTAAPTAPTAPTQRATGHDAGAVSGRAPAMAAASERPVPAGRQDTAAATHDAPARAEPATGASPAGPSRQPQQAGPRDGGADAPRGKGLNEAENAAGAAHASNAPSGTAQAAAATRDDRAEAGPLTGNAKTAAAASARAVSAASQDAAPVSRETSASTAPRAEAPPASAIRATPQSDDRGASASHGQGSRGQGQSQGISEAKGPAQSQVQGSAQASGPANAKAPAEKPTAAAAPAEKPAAAAAPAEKPAAVAAPVEKPAAVPATAEKPAAAAPPVEKPAAVPAPAEKPAVAAAPVERPAAVPASAEAGQPQKDAPAARQAPAMPVENEASMPVAATSDDTTVAATSDVKAVPRQDDRAASFARTGLLTPSQAPAPRFADAMPANAQVQPSATNQIANALASALTDMSPSAGANGADRTRLRAGGAALKTIQIQLAPEQLGKVNVTLKLIEGNLSVHIEAMEPDTASRLKDDAEGLKALLKSAGFDVDDAMITLGSREGGGQRMGQASSMPGDASASGQPRGEGSAGGQSAHGGQSGQRDPSGGRPARPEPVLRPNEAGAESGLRHMGLDPSVYL